MKVNIIKADIQSQQNWREIENYLEHKIQSNIPLLFITFVEMYVKSQTILKSDWVGIIHDPPNTHDFHNNRNILKNPYFINSLPYCRGLFCMSKTLKTWLEESLKPDFFVKVIYHPISAKSLEIWDVNKYIMNPNVYQIGNWLRKSYFIFKLNNTMVQKNVIPYNKRFMQELIHFCKRDKVVITQDDYNSTKKIEYVNDDEYNKIFSNSIVVLNLYSSTCNNVIMECIKSHCPLLINRLPEIEDYLGSEYPLFYNDINDANTKLSDIELITQSHEYLKTLDISKFNIDYFIDEINSELNFA